MVKRKLCRRFAKGRNELEIRGECYSESNIIIQKLDDLYAKNGIVRTEREWQQCAYATASIENRENVRVFGRI